MNDMIGKYWCKSNWLYQDEETKTAGRYVLYVIHLNTHRYDRR